MISYPRKEFRTEYVERRGIILFCFFLNITKLFFFFFNRISQLVKDAKTQIDYSVYDTVHLKQLAARNCPLILKEMEVLGIDPQPRKKRKKSTSSTPAAARVIAKKPLANMVKKKPRLMLVKLFPNRVRMSPQKKCKKCSQRCQ